MTYQKLLMYTVERYVLKLLHIRTVFDHISTYVSHCSGMFISMIVALLFFYLFFPLFFSL